MQGADCDSDHSLVVLKFALKLRRLRKPQASTRFDYSNADQYRVELSNRFCILAKPEASDPANLIQTDKEDTGQRPTSQVPQCQTAKGTMHSHATDGNDESHPNNRWEKLRDNLLGAARATLVTRCKAKRSEWITEETLALIDRKRECCRDSEEYKKLRRDGRRALRRDKRAYLELMCEEMENYEKRHQSDRLYRHVQLVTKKMCPQIATVRKESGEMLTESDEVLDRWRQYCENLYSIQNSDRESEEQEETSEGAEELKWDRTEPVQSTRLRRHSSQ